MIHQLENEYISVKINQLGAELCSYFNKQTEREIIWQGDPKFWKRHAPTLFPIVGKVENNTYRLGQDQFSLSQHGFARDQDFKVLHHSNLSITFQLTNNNQTKDIYPFEFVLEIQFSIQDKELKVLYRVFNPSVENIYFCLGAHPGFNCPFEKHTSFHDYQLKFEKSESSDRILLTPSGFRTGEREEKWLYGDTLSLSEELFREDALIFDDLKSTSLSIESPKSNERIIVTWNNFPHMGIWKPLNNAPFICIEPWNGMADQAELDNDFKEKYGVISLAPQKSFECAYTIENVQK